MALLFLFILTPIYCYAQTTPYSPKEIDSIRQQAKIAGYNGDVDAALHMYDISIRSYTAQKNTLKLTSSIFDQSVVRLYDDNSSINTELERLSNQINTTSDKYTNNTYKATYLYGTFLSGEGGFSEDHYKNTIANLKENKQFLIAHKLETSLAYAYFYNGDLENALRHFENAYSLIDQCPEAKEEEFIDLYTLQSAIYYDIGNFDKALEGSLNAIKIVENYYSIDSVGLAFEYSNLASIYSSYHDYNNGLLYNQKAWGIISNYKGFFPEIEKIGFLISLIRSNKSTDDAQNKIQQYKRVIETLENQQNKSKDQWEDLILTYNGFSLFLLSIDALEEAIEYNDRSVASINKVPLLRADIYNIKSQIAFYQSDLQKTISNIDQAIQYSDDMFGQKSPLSVEFIQSKIESYIKFKKYSLSLSLIQACLERMSVQFNNSSSYSNPALKDVRYKNEFFDLMGLKIKVLNALYKENPDPKIIDAIYDCTKLATEALVEINRTFKNNNSKRFWLNENAIPFYESAIGTAYDLAQSTGEQRYLLEAFQLCEQSKSMLMTDVMQEQQAAELGGVPAELVEQQVELERLVTLTEKERFDAHTAQDEAAEKAASDRLFDYKHQLDLLRHRFELDYPKYYELKYSTPVTTVAEVQDALEEGDYLMEYFEGDGHVYCFLVSKNSFEVVQLKKTAAFNVRLQRFQLSLMDIQRHLEEPIMSYNNYVKDAFQLYQDLLSALPLDQVQRLIVVPDGKLSYLPFEVLLTEARQPVAKDAFRKANFAKLPYLLRQCRVNYLYSAQLWLQQLQRARQTNNGQILGFAPAYQGIVMPNWRQQREVDLRKDLNDLPGAAQEVNQLKAHYRGAYYLDTNANEARFKAEASQYSILHLAMHGLIDQTNPEFSGLALTEDYSRVEDNFLYAYEIKQLPLAADLVVLSACETGIGKYQRGEGVVSLGRGFIYAGAPSLLMTLWSLNDQSGAFIMERFYQNLHEGLPKDEAIRQAKLDYLEAFAPEYAHPFMWAAFVSVGDHRSLTLQTPTPWWYWAVGIGLGLALLGLVIYGLKRAL